MYRRQQERRTHRNGLGGLGCRQRCGGKARRPAPADEVLSGTNDDLNEGKRQDLTPCVLGTPMDEKPAAGAGPIVIFTATYRLHSNKKRSHPHPEAAALTMIVSAVIPPKSLPICLNASGSILIKFSRQIRLA